MDRLGVYFNNITDEIINSQGEAIPVVRKWGHPWFFLGKTEQRRVLLTERERWQRLRRRSVGHPAAASRLRELLKTVAGEDVEEETLRTIKRFSHHWQMRGQAPRRFKFTLKDDNNHKFHHEILVDAIYVNNKLVLHGVDVATAFQGARFLPSLSAKDTLEQLRMLCVDTYRGPPPPPYIITHDAGSTNSASMVFGNAARPPLGIITCRQVPVAEAHWSIGKLERYHGPLRLAFDILHAELAGTGTSAEAILQMVVKAANDTGGP